MDGTPLVFRLREYLSNRFQHAQAFVSHDELHAIQAPALEYGFDSTGAAMRPTEAMKENAHALEGAMMIREMAQELGTPEDKVKRLANLVASHHTAYPFRVGVSPITPEAKLLAVVDNLDSSVSSNFGKDVVFLDGKPVHTGDVA